MEPLFPLFRHNFRILFTLINVDVDFCDRWLTTSSEVTESTENRLEGVCEIGRSRSV